MSRRQVTITGRVSSKYTRAFACDKHMHLALCASHLSLSIRPPFQSMPLTVQTSPFRLPERHMTRTGTAIRSPTKKLRAIDHIEINHFHQRQGVTYYVLDVFTQPAGDALYASSIQVDTLRQRDHHSPLGHPSELTGGEHDNLELQPVYQVERRFSAFEALRNRLSESLETFHPEPCVYCDEFIAFLAQSADQPGLLVKLTTGAPQRPPILERFINRLVQLASTDVDERAAAACDARSVLPQLVEAFLEADST